MSESESTSSSEAILGEIATLKEQRGEFWANNFFLNLPSDDLEGGGGYNRRLARTKYKPGVTHLEWLKEWNQRMSERFKRQRELDTSHGSQLYWSQTPAEFFDTIDQTIEEIGSSVDEVKRLQHRHDNSSNGSQKEEAFKELYDIMEPLIVALMSKGYTSVDLLG